MIYCYQSGKFQNSILIHCLHENGALLGVHEFRAGKDRALEVMSKWPGYSELEWTNTPWSHPGVISAKQNYENYYGASLG